jgi:hypothetical protein
MTVILNSILLTKMFILMVTGIQMAVCLRSKITVGCSIKYSHSLDLHSHPLYLIIKRLKIEYRLIMTNRRLAKHIYLPPV